MKIICRHADNDVHALWTAQAMENAGAEVFSITHNKMRGPEGMALTPSASFLVWAKYNEGPIINPGAIDAAITAEFAGR